MRDLICRNHVPPKKIGNVRVVVIPPGCSSLSAILFIVLRTQPSCCWSETSWTLKVQFSKFFEFWITTDTKTKTCYIFRSFSIQIRFQIIGVSWFNLTVFHSKSNQTPTDDAICPSFDIPHNQTKNWPYLNELSASL